MHINIKWIIIGIILLGFLALFIWNDRIHPGSVIAGLAAFIATLKSKFFGSEKDLGKIALIQRSHEQKRQEWEEEKKQYEHQYFSLKTHIEELDKRIAQLNEQLENTSKPDYKPSHRSDEEILRWLKSN